MPVGSCPGVPAVPQEEGLPARRQTATVSALVPTVAGMPCHPDDHLFWPGTAADVAEVAEVAA